RGLARARGRACRGPRTRERRVEVIAPVCGFGAVRGAETIAHWRQHRTCRHARFAGDLPRRERRHAAVRRPAARCVHRRGGATACGAHGRQAMIRRAITVVILSSWASGCVVGPRYTPPQVPLPRAWQEAPITAAATVDRSALAQWWTTFGDPVLDGLVARAIEGNLDLRIAAARVREARAARGIAAAAALPQVDVNGQYVRTERSNAVPPFNAPGVSGFFGPRIQNLFDV